MCSFLWLSNSPLYKYTTTYLSIHLLTFRLLPCYSYCRECCNDFSTCAAEASNAAMILKGLLNEIKHEQKSPVDGRERRHSTWETARSTFEGRMDIADIKRKARKLGWA